MPAETLGLGLVLGLVLGLAWLEPLTLTLTLRGRLADLDGIVGDFEPQLRLEERTRRLGLVDVAEDLGGRGLRVGVWVEFMIRVRVGVGFRLRAANAAYSCLHNQGQGQGQGEARAEREGKGECGLAWQTSSVLVPCTLGPMPQFPRQPQLLMREVISDSVAHASGSV